MQLGSLAEGDNVTDSHQPSQGQLPWPGGVGLMLAFCMKLACALLSMVAWVYRSPWRPLGDAVRSSHEGEHLRLHM